MDFILVTFKLVAALVMVLVSAYAKFHPTLWLLGRRGKSRIAHDYEFITQFLQVPVEERNHLEVELAFYAWRRKLLRYLDIVAILRFANPSVAFKWYDSVARFVILGPDGRFAFRQKFAIPHCRRVRVRFWTTMYVVCSMFAAAPLWMATTMHQTPPSPWALIAVPFLFVFGAAALLTLDYAAALSLSEKFMAEQKL